jgi:hypothetical protein
MDGLPSHFVRGGEVRNPNTMTGIKTPVVQSLARLSVKKCIGSS